ncbi:MAG: hypothetical protein EAZ97_07985 [Bacteroidetes bacterium]|nr:MAG: hypothetical protein EAZ97_07985 [Bacteroidota bacterium]
MLFACKDKKEEQKRIERIVRQEILSKTNSKAAKLELIEEKEDQYLAVADLENGQKIQAIFVGNADKYIFKETLGSEVARQISDMFGVFCSDLSLKPIDSLNYSANAKLVSGENMNLRVVVGKGWYPTDSLSLKTMLTYQVKDYLGVDSLEISLTATDSINYQGKTLLNTGEKMDFSANQYGDWFVNNDLESLMTATKYEFIKTNPKLSLHNLQIGKSKMENLYEGQVVISDEKKIKDTQKLLVEYQQKGFQWKVVPLDKK